MFEVFETRAVEREPWRERLSCHGCLLRAAARSTFTSPTREPEGQAGELQSIKAQLRTRHGLAVAEVDHQDAWQRSTLAAAACSGSLRTLDEPIDG